jgi:formamidopyrimidine-DNA glycosylase
MPELPEVETARRGITPHIQDKIFRAVIIRQAQLRWPVPMALTSILPGLVLSSVERRGKYLLLSTAEGTLLLHLGMSGNLRITDSQQALRKHDHVDFIFEDDTILRLNDPRKFGAVLWTDDPVEQHPLLTALGPEPLSPAFDADYLLTRVTKRRVPIKSLIMDSHVVVGVGNIYASEALFMAGLLPTRPAGEIDFQDCQRLVTAVQDVLQRAIDQGGTTLRDFTNAEGKPGYFQQQLSVYGRAEQPCLICSQPIRHLKIAQRASYYCDSCQH